MRRSEGEVESSHACSVRGRGKQDIRRAREQKHSSTTSEKLVSPAEAVQRGLAEQLSTIQNSVAGVFQRGQPHAQTLA